MSTAAEDAPYALTRDARRSDWSELVRRWASTQPDKIALRHAGASRSYLELHSRADLVCDLLIAEGLRPGDRLAVLSGNRLQLIDIFVGAMRAGVIVVPINTRLSTDEIAYQLQDCGAGVVIADPELADVHRAAFDAAPALCFSSAENPTVGSSTLEEALARIARDGSKAGTPAPRPFVEMTDPAFIIYTSGTTGRPKGAVLAQSNLLLRGFASLGLMNATSPDEVWYAGLPLFHVGGLAGVLNHLFLGGCAVIADTGNFNAAQSLREMREVGATSAFFVPTQWDAICAAVSEGAEPGPSLRRLVWGAAPASRATLEAMAAAFPGIPNISTFGQTEVAGASCILKGDDAERRSGSVGRQLPGVAVRIVDEEMNDVPVGQVGEIVYQGPTVFLGYWRNPQATEEAMQGGWFHSGDLCRMDEDGYVWVVDRKKDMIVSGGENIYSAEVETALSTHPLISDVAVVGMPHERWGETPLAVVVPQPGAQLDENEVIEHARGLLASYKKPSRVVFVGSLPRNASGKVLKTVLRDTYGATTGHQKTGTNHA